MLLKYSAFFFLSFFVLCAYKFSYKQELGTVDLFVIYIGFLSVVWQRKGTLVQMRTGSCQINTTARRQNNMLFIIRTEYYTLSATSAFKPRVFFLWVLLYVERSVLHKGHSSTASFQLSLKTVIRAAIRSVSRCSEMQQNTILKSERKPMNIRPSF